MCFSEEINLKVFIIQCFQNIKHKTTTTTECKKIFGAKRKKENLALFI